MTPTTGAPATTAGDTPTTPRPAIDGALETTLTGPARHAALTLLHTARRDAWNVTLLETTLTNLTHQARRWKDAWAAQKITGEQQTRDAAARALDCTDHGHLIAGLEQQLDATSRQYRSATRSRIAYVQGHTGMRQALHQLQARIRAGDTDVPDLATVVDALTALADDIHRSATWR